MNNKIYEHVYDATLNLDSFFKKNVDGIYYLSHASILVILNGKKFLFDPVLAKPPHLGSWLFFPNMKFDKCLFNVDGVFISHQHQDHFDIEFIQLLPKTIPIYVISGRPQFTKLLKEENISFIEIPENGIFQLGNDVFCFGITHEYNGIDSAIVISNQKLTIYHGNDCFVSNDKLKIIKDFFPRVDIACIPFAYVHWYPFLLDDVDPIWKKEESDRLIKKYLDLGISQIKTLSPEIAIPFGSNMFYFDDVNSDHNKAVVSPFDFKNYADQINFDKLHVIQTLFAGDYIIKEYSNNNLNIFSNKLTKEDLLSGLNDYIHQVRISGTGFDSQQIMKIKYSDLSDYSFIFERLKISDLKINHNIYITNSIKPEIGLIEINLKSFTILKVFEINTDIPFHHFKLTELAFKAYFSKKFTFNEIIASSQFRLTRHPNIYDLNVLKIINNVL